MSGLYHASDAAANIEAALQYLPPDCDRDTWVRIGMAVKAALGDGGFNLWDTWSQGADSYREADARAAWRSFHSNGEIQGATLFHMAIQAGWRPEGGKPPPLLVPTTTQEAERVRQAREDAERQAAARKAFNIWRYAPIAIEHPYLSAKGIMGHYSRLFQGALVLPLFDADTQIMNLQFIQRDGKKRFLKGGKKSGCFWWVGKSITETLCIAEGFATAASIHETTGFRCYVAFDAGNLPKVGAVIRAQFPDTNIVICADHDETGIKYAKLTAENINASIAMPENPGEDFNDVARSTHE